jgi:2-amino-4-hydroxy-6-hydroxymethyldihydropteridine diphosphokinase
LARVFIGLGANLGDRETALRRSLELLEESGAAEVRAVSELIETAPVGGPAGQPDYLNGAAEIETPLPPEGLLAALKEIERRLGRVERERWGAREIDMDVLLYDDKIINTPDLEVPHPRMCERLFVLQPLAKIAPGVRHPKTGLTVKEHLAALEAKTK